MADRPEYTYIVVRGLPREFGKLTAAEEVAAELCERDRESYTVLAVPPGTLADKAIVAIYRGVLLSTLAEARELEEE